jgi:phage-related protein
MYNFRVKVRQDTYIWGGAGINVPTKAKAYLHFRVDETGESISITIIKNDGQQEAIGELKPGEGYTLRLENLRGVKAVCPPEQHDTFVDCTILSAMND